MLAVSYSIYTLLVLDILKNCNLAPKSLGVFLICPCVKDRTGNLKWLVFMVKGKSKYPEKTSRNNGENKQQTQPRYGVHARIC